MSTTALSIGTAAILAALQRQHDSIPSGGSHPNRGWNDIHRDGMRDGLEKAIELLTGLATVPVSVSAQDRAAWIEKRMGEIWGAQKSEGEEGWQVNPDEYARAAIEAFCETPAAWMINDGHNPPYATLRQADADKARAEGWDVQPLVLAADFTPRTKQKEAR